MLHGAGGDLAKRKIIPALAHLALSGYFAPESRVVFVQRENQTADEALASVDEFLTKAGDEAARKSLPALKPYLSTCQLTLGEPEAAQALREAVAGGPEPVVHYAALPSSRFIDLINCLDEVRDPEKLRLVLEKPLGFNAKESAKLKRQWPPSWMNRRCTASTITWANKLCKTCLPCVWATAFSNLC